MRYVTANQISKDTDKLYNEGISGGLYIGFQSLKDFYNVKKGCTTYITGIPSHGKTQFHFEMLMNLADFNQWKHAIFTPETGSPAEIIAELSHCYIKKSFDKRMENRMTIQEKYKADAFLSEYFYIMQPEEDKITIKELLSICLEIKLNHGLDSFSVDPFNELKHDFSEHGGREDKYLEFTLGLLRRFAREHNIHVFIVAHPRTLRPIDGRYEPPTAFELSGGAAWYSKAESILCVHRPTKDTNEVQIIIQKAKPKHIGKKGEATLYWDREKNRYYEILDPIYKTKQYATKNFTQKKEKELKSFTEPQRIEEAPF